MKENVVSIQQIKEAKRLHRAIEITSGSSSKITFSEMLDRVVKLDRQSETEIQIEQERNRRQND
jgi:hypothetical protein